MWYSGWSPIATVMNFLIAQGHSPGDSNLPERNNKVTRIFLMSARWNWIIVLDFPLMRFLVSEEHISCNQSNLHLQGIEILKLLIVAPEIDVHPSYNAVRETWESSRCLFYFLRSVSTWWNTFWHATSTCLAVWWFLSISPTGTFLIQFPKLLWSNFIPVYISLLLKWSSRSAFSLFRKFPAVSLFYPSIIMDSSVEAHDLERKYWNLVGFLVPGDLLVPKNSLESWLDFGDCNVLFGIPQTHMSFCMGFTHLNISLICFLALGLGVGWSFSQQWNSVEKTHS